jgi:glycosyltransferase involved in cell wall biosynthesis
MQPVAKKLLLIVGATPPIPCGVGDQTYYLAKKLTQDFKIKVILYTSYNPKITDENSLKIYFFSVSKIKFYLKLVYILLTELPDVVHVSYPNRGYAFGYPFSMVLWCKLLFRKTLITFHEKIVPPARFHNYLLKTVPEKIVLVREELASEMNIPTCEVITNFSTIPSSEISESEAAILKLKIAGRRKLCAHFGFVAPSRCIDKIFDIVNPEEYHLLIIGSLDNNLYAQSIQKKIWSPAWAGNVTVTGYLNENIIADLLFAADVVVLPFENGSHDANTTTKAVMMQGTYLITTSVSKRGYDEKVNAFYTQPGNYDEIKGAMNRKPIKLPKGPKSGDSIEVIAKKYYNIYNELYVSNPNRQMSNKR